MFNRESFIKFHRAMLPSLFKVLIPLLLVISSGFLVDYLVTKSFSYKIFLVVIAVLSLVVYLFAIGVQIYNNLSTTPRVQLKIAKYKPLLRKLPYFLLIVYLIIQALFLDYTLYERESLMNIINLTWVIFGLNITVFTFSYAFIKRSLEEKKRNLANNVKGFLAKSNYNEEIHSRYATFYYILINAVVLVLSTASLYIVINDEMSTLIETLM